MCHRSSARESTRLKTELSRVQVPPVAPLFWFKTLTCYDNMMEQKLTNLKKSQGIYDYDAIIDRIYNLIEKELSDNNVEIIKEYDKVMINQSLAKATRQKHLQTVLSLSRLLNKDWKDATKQDIDNLVFRIMKEYSSNLGQETNTSFDHKKVLKIFFRWFKLGSRDFKEVEDPAETKGIKMKRVKDKIIREDLITETDKTRLLFACGENARDRALIDCQTEAGTRPGEILNLLIKHVKFDKYGAILHVDGKTGPRTVRLVSSTPNLANWLAVHPFRNNPEAPLWMMLNKKRYGQMMSYVAARQMLMRRCMMANLSKRIYLNLFRHSEATTTAKFMTEAQMRKRHGWSADSRMPARYVHLVNADVDDAIFSYYGINDKKNVEKRAVPKKCVICEMLNSPEAEICSKCGKPLDLTTALKIDDANEARLSAIEEKLNLLLNALPR